MDCELLDISIRLLYLKDRYCLLLFKCHILLLCIYYHFAVVLLPIKALIFFAFILLENSIQNNSIYLDPNGIFALAE